MNRTEVIENGKQEIGAEACGRELKELLDKHQCRLSVFFSPPESVGCGSKLLLSANVKIVQLEQS